MAHRSAAVRRQSSGSMLSPHTDRVSEGGAEHVARDGAFLNSDGRDQRDLTIIALLAHAETTRAPLNSLVVVDALAATGLRSLRIAREVPQVGKIFANDNSPDAFRCLCKNVEESKASLAGCEVKLLTSCEDAATLLTDLASQKELVDFIDLDPFGSPINIVPSALRCLKHGGLLSMAFFDVQVLTGFGHGSSELCFSRYGAQPLNMRCSKELGIRIALACVSKFALQLDRNLEPLICAYVNCCVRIIARVTHQDHEHVCDSKHVGSHHMVWKCTNCEYWEMVGADSSVSKKCEVCGNQEKELGGPIWSASLVDKNFFSVCKRTLEKVQMERNIADADNLSILFRELSAELPNPLFYDFSFFSRCSARSDNSFDRTNILRTIEKAGYKVSHSHTAVNLAVKTDAPNSFLTQMLQKLSAKLEEPPVPRGEGQQTVGQLDVVPQVNAQLKECNVLRNHPRTMSV
ncbi:hypothetical protein GUITHDRAFT_98999 [Guillardia theta CCMP2712]|uniref:tRNA (guanine(26)-N(2))-dimethyltransferase n=1 Tax=Guillardia theta (strain CCMP2712) TaxID=905079 RepID=L1K418_GUITC|nr:hypothetical protein GUITHDRAFT_98999 [Guillardia theta CCMP2712]EKX55220.1 hypothetical protein GUITHDRAFT_98999 [Guillardia theta CCMP2712]|eukprot:XP_005842200.1 hypothetical protein GUITHDRAFT_98999 [Guillardia theta CCMP2712]